MLSGGLNDYILDTPVHLLPKNVTELHRHCTDFDFLRKTVHPAQQTVTQK